MKPDSHGLTFLPLLAGERGPGWADLANGTVAGLSMSTKPVEILRAAMEAVAFRFAIIAEMLETASPGEKEVIASGGGLLHSPTWTRIMADTLGKPVTLSGVKEASSRGAALLALEALGGPEIEDAEAPLGETFDPDPERHEIYRKPSNASADSTKPCLAARSSIGQHSALRSGSHRTGLTVALE